MSLALSGRALLTDLYQLTMAQGYFAAGRADDQAVFHLFFRSLPFQGGFAVACGLADVVDYLDGLAFDAEDLAYLATVPGDNGHPIFRREFLDYLGSLRFSLDVDAIPEGTVVFANEPLVRVRGPLLQAQCVETALLNLINFPTLVATKAARVCAAAGNDPVLEFGLRRAQGHDGALCASRAAYVGGCAATSNVLAGKRYGIPVRGTHAHSWVMSFDTEIEAFESYALAMPNNAVFLVDTYDTLEGVRNAIRVARTLRERGHRLGGVRLDSGDLAALSIEARRLLDEEGFPDAVIVASNDLDEHLIEHLKSRGACIGIWGVGTKLVTAHDQPALGGVYKLAAIRPSVDVPFRSVVKLSDDEMKISIPGIQQVRRYVDPHDGHFVADVIIDEEHPSTEAVVLVDRSDSHVRRQLPADLPWHELLVPIFRGGRRVYDVPDAASARARAQEELRRLPGDSRSLREPRTYPVGLEQGLADRRLALVRAAKERTPS